MAVRAMAQETILDITDAYTVYLTCASYTFAGTTTTAKAGSCTTQVRAFCGADEVAASVDVARVSKPNGVSVSSNGDPMAPTLTVSVTTAVAGPGKVTIPVAVGDATFPLEFSFGVALTGQTGAQGAQGQAGARGATGAAGADGRMLVATSSTPAGAAAKVAALRAGSLSLAAGASVTVVFSQANTAASPTLNVAGTGAKAIRTNGAPYAYWVAGTAVSFVFDGTYWQVCSVPVYASTVTVGNPAGGNVYIDSDSVDIRRGGNTITAFGVGSPGTAHAGSKYVLFDERNDVGIWGDGKGGVAVASPTGGSVGIFSGTYDVHPASVYVDGGNAYVKAGRGQSEAGGHAYVRTTDGLHVGSDGRDGTGILGVWAGSVVKRVRGGEFQLWSGAEFKAITGEKPNASHHVILLSSGDDAAMRSLLTASIQANENVICTSSKNLPYAGHRFNYLIVKF